jgi:hypothetical protein
MATEEKLEPGGERRRSQARAAEKRATSLDLDEVKTDLAAIVDAHPVGALAAALGVGYVLGGGVFTRLTSRIVRLGLRLGIQLAVVPILEQQAATIMGLEPPPTEPEATERPGKGRTPH